MAPLFDAHFHIIDPRHPLVPNRGYVPDSFPVEAYRERARSLGVVGGAVVAGSFQGFDRGWLADALDRLGPGFVGVAQLEPEVSDAELDELDALGVRAVRLNLRRCGSAGAGPLNRLARRVFDRVGWHAELYVDAAAIDASLFRTLDVLPAASIDHLGLSAAGLPTLLRLVERGVKVKASGFGRLDGEPQAVLRRIAAVDPTALMFGTDLPSTRAPRPFEPADLERVHEALGPELARRALHDNGVAFYRPRR